MIKHRPAAKATMDLKFRAVFSHRSATRLNRLSLPTPCSRCVRGLCRGCGRRKLACSFRWPCWRGESNGSDAARSRGVPIGLAGVAFVADDGARLNVGSDLGPGGVSESHQFVEGFAAGQIEGDDIPGGVRFCVDFRGEAAARTPKRLAFLPPFAPAADTCARTMVESNI